MFGASAESIPDRLLGLGRLPLVGYRPATVVRAAVRGDEEAHRPGPLFARRRWGEKSAGRPLRGCSSRPGRRANANRLRHLLTICRGVSKRVAMLSLGRPCAARSTILARMTSRYGDVYFRVRASSSSRSWGARTIRKGLERGKACPPRTSLVDVCVTSKQ